MAASNNDLAEDASAVASASSANWKDYQMRREMVWTQLWQWAKVVVKLESGTFDEKPKYLGNSFELSSP